MSALRDSAFILGGIAVPLYARLEWSQTYRWLEGATTHRMWSGRSVKQSTWRKLATEISGGGWVPSGLSALDYSQPLVLACAAPLAIVGGGTPPVPVRTEADFATVTLNVDGVDITYCYPKITVYCDPPQEQLDGVTGNYGWRLSAEMVDPIGG